DEADLERQTFDRLVESDRLAAVTQRDHGVAEIEQIEPNDQQMIDGVGEFLLVVHEVDEERAAPRRQAVCDPDRQGSADDNVGDVIVGQHDTTPHWTSRGSARLWRPRAEAPSVILFRYFCLYRTNSIYQLPVWQGVALHS